jgi:hypothetical protein
LDIANAERSGVRGKTIFARAEEVVGKTEICNVGRGTAKGVASPTSCRRRGGRFGGDKLGWWVLFGVVAVVKGGKADIKLAKAV